MSEIHVMVFECADGTPSELLVTVPCATVVIADDIARSQSEKKRIHLKAFAMRGVKAQRAVDASAGKSQSLLTSSATEIKPRRRDRREIIAHNQRPDWKGRSLLTSSATALQRQRRIPAEAAKGGRP